MTWWFISKRGRYWATHGMSDEQLSAKGYGTGIDAARKWANDALGTWAGPYLTREEARKAAFDATNKGKEPDEGHNYADEKIDSLTKRFDEAYGQASREMGEKLQALMSDYEEKNAEWKARVGSGEATQDEYEAWLRGRATSRAFVGGMADTLAQDASDVDMLVRDYINDEIPSVYAENANFAAYQVESGLGFDTHSFDLYDVSTVRRMLGMSDDDQILHEVVLENPTPPMQTLRADPDRVKDVRWNRQKFNAALTQSILQGESIPHTAKRLQGVLNMDRDMAVRAARTAMTSAENAGRVDSYKRAERIGIKVEQEWMATLDERTRDTHRELDGQHVPVGKYFVIRSNGHKLRWPADPAAHPSEIWNCRCTLVAWLPDIEQEDPERWSKLPSGMSYDEWKTGKRKASGQHANPDSPIWSAMEAGLSAIVRGKVNEMLSGAHGKVAAIWSKFEGDMRLADPDHTDRNGKPKGAYYAWRDGVHMTVKRSVENAGNRGTLATWFHEFGHNIDNIAKGTRFGMLSDEWMDGKFRKALQEDVGEYVKARHAEIKRRASEMAEAMSFDEVSNLKLLRGQNRITYTQYNKYVDAMEEYKAIRGLSEEEAARQFGYSAKDYRDAMRAGERAEKAIRKAIASRESTIAVAYREIGREITSDGLDTQLALGDIFEGATKGKASDTYGHGKSYWDGAGRSLAHEAFAEFYSAECIYSERPQIFDKMMERLPRAYAAYAEMTEELAR